MTVPKGTTSDTGIRAMASLYVNPKLTIDDALLTWSASRSSGPGGQNVNKVNSRVSLRFDLPACQSIGDGWRRRFEARFGRVVLADGTVLLHSDASRDQRRNLEDARQRLASMLRACYAAERPRRATRPSRSSQRRRVENKRQHSEKKRGRGQRYDRGGE